MFKVGQKVRLVAERDSIRPLGDDRDVATIATIVDIIDENVTYLLEFESDSGRPMVLHTGGISDKKFLRYWVSPFEIVLEKSKPSEPVLPCFVCGSFGTMIDECCISCIRNLVSEAKNCAIQS